MDTLETTGKATVERMRLQQIGEWLRQADRYIRAGRYLAADELLQKVTRFQPHNEIATNYQQRIQFLVQQLSQRVGLDLRTQTEVRRFMEILNSRKSNQVNAYLFSAKSAMEEGHFQKSQEQLTKALAVDSANTYAKALQQRLNDLRRQTVPAAENENETHFRSFLTELWRTGKPGTEHDGLIASTQATLQVTHARRIEILRGVKNALYKEALQEIWLTGGLAAFDMETVEELRTKFEISWLDHSVIETGLLREVRKNRVRGNILIVDSDDTNLVTVSRILRSHHYGVIAAGSVNEALAAVKTVAPDLMLSEMDFSDGSLGFDLFAFVRETNSLKNTPFLFMTSSHDRTTQLIGKRLGVDDFVPKPVDAELLVATVTGLLLRRAPQTTSSVHSSGVAHFFKK